LILLAFLKANFIAIVHIIIVKIEVITVEVTAACLNDCIEKIPVSINFTATGYDRSDMIVIM
jgi:hypothetical protein